MLRHIDEHEPLGADRNRRRRPDAIDSFVDRLAVDGFDHAIDGAGSIWASYGILGQPSFAFIDEDGAVTTHTGPLGVAGLSERIDELLAT